MRLIESVVRSELVLILANIVAVGLGMLAAAVVILVALHTLYLFGRRTPVYHKRAPEAGWSKRFYPASSLLIILLLALMWLLNVWSHTVHDS